MEFKRKCFALTVILFLSQWAYAGPTNELFTKIDEVLIALPSAHSKQIKEMVEKIRELTSVTKIRILPGVTDLINGKITLSDIHEVRLEDLLGRSPDSVGIFVTHLAKEIAKYCKEEIRIDGIEAKGLSENLELIVDRTPKFYKYAKSTPELIVQRLQQVSKGSEKEIFAYILDAFK